MITEHDAILRLRQDAVDRGMLELAIAYGWSALRLGEETLADKASKLGLDLGAHTPNGRHFGIQNKLQRPTPYREPPSIPQKRPFYE